MDLIVKPDIDIVVSSEIKYEDFLKFVNYIFLNENVYNLHLQDFRKSIYPNRPQWLYCGVTYLAKPKTFWKIDVWFFSKEQAGAKKLVDSMKEKLTNEKRLTILKIKNEMLDTKHGKEISGIDVYKAVLETGMNDLERFRQYLKKQGREL